MACETVSVGWHRDTFLQQQTDRRLVFKNTTSVILTFLPYHTTPLFLKMLSILPRDLTSTFKVLYPYKQNLINPPRHPILHSAATNKQFFSSLSNYVLKVSRQRAHHHALLAFWAGIATEAVAMMVESTRSGRQETEKAKHEDILLQVLPVLNEIFAMKKVSELVIGGYMVSVVLAQKLALEDKVTDGLMEAVVGSWTDETILSGFICLSVLARKKSNVKLPKKVFKAILRLESPVRLLSDIAVEYRTSELVLGLLDGCVENIGKQDIAHLDLLSTIFQSKLLGESDISRGMAMVLRAVGDVYASGTLSLDAQMRLADIVQQFNQSDYFRPIFEKTLAESSFDIPALEHHLQTVIDIAPETSALKDGQDVEMRDTVDGDEGQDTFSRTLELLAKEDIYGSSFLLRRSIPVFERLAQLFSLAVGSQDRIESFANLPVLGKADAARNPPFVSFFVRVFSGHYLTGARAAALDVISHLLDSDSSACTHTQALLPFLLVALADPSERIRRAAAGVIVRLGDFYKNIQKEQSHDSKAGEVLYGQDKRLGGLAWLSMRDVRRILEHALLLELEECVLDSSQISKVLVRTLRGSAIPEGSGTSELKKSLRFSLFTFLCSHALHVPLFSVKLGLLRLLNRVDRAGGSTRTRELQPLLVEWRGLNSEEVQDICSKEHLNATDIEQQIVTIVTRKDKEAITILLSSVSPGSDSLRPSFVDAIFGRMKDIWAKLPGDQQYMASDKLFDISLGLQKGDLPLVDGCKDVLRTVDLNGSILLHFLRKIPASLTDDDDDGLSRKRRRTSRNNMVAMTVKDDAELSKLMEKATFVLELVDNSAPETHPELADALFQTLAALQHFKSRIHSGMSYLLSLTLGSLLAIVNKSKVSFTKMFSSFKPADSRCRDSQSRNLTLLSSDQIWLLIVFERRKVRKCRMWLFFSSPDCLPLLPSWFSIA